MGCEIYEKPYLKGSAMKAKTKAQLVDETFKLRAEITDLKKNCAALKIIIREVFLALPGAVKVCLVEEPNNFSAFANFVATFLALLKEHTEVDFTTVIDDEDFDFMGFDEVTTMVVKEQVPRTTYIYKEILRMVKEGKSEEEIDEFFKKHKEEIRESFKKRKEEEDKK